MPADRPRRSLRLRRTDTIAFLALNPVDPSTPHLSAAPPLDTPTTPVRQSQIDPPKTEPSTPTSPTIHTRGYRRGLARERSAQFVSIQAVLHYDRVENDLQPWFWPVNEAGERVTPSNLIEYRRSHEFKGPSCLCASLDADEHAYTEASIFVATSGPDAGKYVAACATGLCRYWVCIESLYSYRGLLVRRFPLRGTSNFVPQPATPKSHSSATRALRDTESHIGSVIDLVVQESQLPVTPPEAVPPMPVPTSVTQGISGFVPSIAPESYFGLLLQLDDISEPGITEEVFREIFARCDGCRKYMTKRTTMFHHCE